MGPVGEAVEDGAEVVDERDLGGLFTCFRGPCSPGSGLEDMYVDGMNGLL